MSPIETLETLKFETLDIAPYVGKEA
jgi:hypothetical protein